MEGMFAAFEFDELRLISGALAHEIGLCLEMELRYKILVGENWPDAWNEEKRKLIVLHNESLAEMDRRNVNAANS